MSVFQRHRLGILVAAVVVLFTGIGATTFWDLDEAIYAEIVREMIAGHDWVVPLFNGELVTDKPPMVYWLMIAGFEVFGPSEFAARAAFAALAVATVLLTYNLGCRLYSQRAGLWAALALTTNFIFDISARACTPDSPLLFCTVAAFWLYVRAGGLEGAAIRWPTWMAIYASMGVGTLAKGPVAFVLPVAVMILFHLLANRTSLHPTELVKRAWSIGLRHRPLMAVAMIAIVAGPWFYAVGARTDGVWLRSFFLEHNAERFLKPNMGHSGPVYYHVLGVMLGFFPWSVFLPQAIVHLVRRVRQNDAWRRADLFVACWAGMYIVFFSFARTKLPNYVLPAYPALALATGAFLDAWLRQPSVANFTWLRAAFLSTAAGGLVMSIGLAIAAMVALPGESWIGVVGLAPLVGGAVATVLYDRHRRDAALATFTVSAAVLMLALFAVAGPAVNRHNSAPRIVAAWSANASPIAPLATFRHLDPSEAYYAGRMVKYCINADDVKQFFASAPEACMVVRTDEYLAAAPALPNDVVVLDRRDRFLKGGELLMLGRPNALRVAKPQTPAITR